MNTNTDDCGALVERVAPRISHVVDALRTVAAGLDDSTQSEAFRLSRGTEALRHAIDELANASTSLVLAAGIRKVGR